jgi:exopolysaccharide production protein ExoQ
MDFPPLLVIGFCIPIACVFLWVTLAAAKGRTWAIQLYLGTLVFVIPAMFRKRELSAMGADWQTILKFALVLGALIISLAQFNKILPLILSPPLSLMLAYASWAVISSVYSVTPTYTFISGLMFLSLVCFAAMVANHLTIRQILISMVVSWTMFLAVSWVVYLYLPMIGQTGYWTSAGQIYRFAGLAGHANMMGRILAMMIISLVLLYTHRYVKPFWMVICLVFLSGTLLMTQSRTSAAAVLLVVAFIYMKRRPLVILSLCCIVSFLLIFLQYSSPAHIDTASLSRSGSADEITSFTGRTKIWEYVLGQIKKGPWYGYGYAGGRIVISQGWNSHGWTTSHAHNMWLQSLLTVGIVGTIPLVVAVVQQLIVFFNKPHPMRDAALLFVLFTGMLEAGAVGPTPNIVTLFWLIAISAAIVEVKDIPTNTEYSR